MCKVVLLGEPLMRLSPEGNVRFLQADRMDVHFGGAEANVAVCLASLGLESYYVSKVPAHTIGDAFVGALRREGVHMDYVARGGERIGIYYLENGASVRPSKVIYDRLHSSLSEAVIEDFDWDMIMADASLFHVTGITTVISEKAAKLTGYAVCEAKKRGIPVSLDLNYRAKLWESDVKAKQGWMCHLAEYADYCFGNPLDAERTLGYQDPGHDFEREDFVNCIAEAAVKRMAGEYGFKGVFFTVRESFNASFNRLSARACWDGRYVQTQTVDLQIVDRVGGDDAFAAGILYGIVTRKDLTQALEIGLAAGAIAHTIPGDFTMTSQEEIENIIKSGGTGRVQR